MKGRDLRHLLSDEFGLGKWPSSYEVDAETYATICQEIFDHIANQDGGEVNKDFTVYRHTLSFGPNRGIMYKNVELILNNNISSLVPAPVESKHLTLDELKTLYRILEHEYISYEDMDAINLVRKVRSLIGEDI